MTVLEAIQRSAAFLAKRGVESPRLQTELLLAHHVKMPRMNLYLNFERVLTTAETDALRESIVRRGRREPLQHIIGSTSFCGCEIAVNCHALVPRPETELLAEEGWKFLVNHCPPRGPSDPRLTLTLSPPIRMGAERKQQTDANDHTDALRDAAGAKSQDGILRALDFGTGTGCIAIALAAKCPDAKVIATDISPDALALAKENATRNNVVERIEFVQADGLAAVSGNQFNLIISNPPYVPTAEIESLQPEVRDFDPRAALDGGVDGLDFYRMLAARGKSRLKPSGKIMLEFGDGQAEAIRRLFENEMWIVEAVKEDYSQRARILVAKV